MPSLECPSIYNAIDFAGPEGLEETGSQQHQASVVIVLVSGPQNGVCLLPTELGDKVAKLHGPQLDAKLTVLTQEQAHETKVESSFQRLHSPFLGCKFQSMVLSLAVVAVLSQRPQTRKKETYKLHS